MKTEHLILRDLIVAELVTDLESLGIEISGTIQHEMRMDWQELIAFYLSPSRVQEWTSKLER